MGRPAEAFPSSSDERKTCGSGDGVAVSSISRQGRGLGRNVSKEATGWSLRGTELPQHRDEIVGSFFYSFSLFFCFRLGDLGDFSGKAEFRLRRVAVAPDLVNMAAYFL